MANDFVRNCIEKLEQEVEVVFNRFRLVRIVFFQCPGFVIPDRLWIDTYNLAWLVTRHNIHTSQLGTLEAEYAPFVSHF